MVTSVSIPLEIKAFQRPFKKAFSEPCKMNAFRSHFEQKLLKYPVRASMRKVWRKVGAS
jgi:hypothetical protein